MDKVQYEKIENYMKECMKDSAHDKEHIYRVLYLSLEIAKNEMEVDMEVLIASCLLHDIGREAQFKNPTLCHAIIGGEMAYEYLIKSGWNTQKAEQVKNCIATHRFRSDNPPNTIEAKILFDSDKLDVTGTLGIARTLLYKGKVSEPLYSVDYNRNVLYGANDENPSFFHEYNFKLKNLYSRFYTQRGTQIAKEREASAVAFYNSILSEVKFSYERGTEQLSFILRE
jgi:uncharacterized protein